MATPDPGPRAQLDASNRSMLPIEEANLASAPGPSCRAQRAGSPCDQRDGEGPRAQAFLHLPLSHSGLQTLDGAQARPGLPIHAHLPYSSFVNARKPPPQYLTFDHLSYSE